jgi:hypothetical protein
LDLIFSPDWRSGHRFGWYAMVPWMDAWEGVSKENSLSEEEKKVKYFSATFFAKDFWTMIFLIEAKFCFQQKIVGILKQIF